MNNKISVSATSLGLTYAGCFFGAGYVSGQELWQFFGSFGKCGFIGMLLTLLLFFFFGVMLVRCTQLANKSTFDEVLIGEKYSSFRIIIGAITVFLMFGIIVVMAAGAGSLVNQIFDLPSFIGCGLFCLLVCIIGMTGIGGILKVFSYVIPVLVITTLIICVFAISEYGIYLDYENTNKNPMLINWWFSSVNYVSYNIISLIGTIIPISVFVKKKSTAYSGILFGCIIAMSLAFGILFTLSGMQASVQTELPMLDIAFVLSPIFGYIYSILLLLAMFGTALASLVAIVEYAKDKLRIVKKHNTASVILIGIASFIFSLAGFGTLVGTVYPAFGYIGFIILALILYRFIKLKLKG